MIDPNAAHLQKVDVTTKTETPRVFPEPIPGLRFKTKAEYDRYMRRHFYTPSRDGIR